MISSKSCRPNSFLASLHVTYGQLKQTYACHDKYWNFCNPQLKKMIGISPFRNIHPDTIWLSYLQFFEGYESLECPFRQRSEIVEPQVPVDVKD